MNQPDRGDRLTVDQAADLTGIPYKTIWNACRHGYLPAKKGRVRGYPNKPVWLIERSDLLSYRVRHKPSSPSRPWTDADDAALMELRETCSISQMSQYLERSYAAVQSRLRWLRGRGEEWATVSGFKNPFHCPSTGVWLAKTCPGCGFLRDISQYTFKPNRQGRLSPLTECHPCGLAKLEKRPSRKSYQERREQQQAWFSAVQRATVANAHDGRREYTSAELEVLSDVSKSNFQVALELKRTYAGVCTKRSAMGIKIRQPKKTFGHWVIEFPEAMRVLREYYRELGVVPESEWDWNDEEIPA